MTNFILHVSLALSTPKNAIDFNSVHAAKTESFKAEMKLDIPDHPVHKRHRQDKIDRSKPMEQQQNTALERSVI